MSLAEFATSMNVEVEKGGAESRVTGGFGKDNRTYVCAELIVHYQVISRNLMLVLDNMIFIPLDEYVATLDV